MAHNYIKNYLMDQDQQATIETKQSTDFPLLNDNQKCLIL